MTEQTTTTTANIELRLQDINQLFNSLDPSPFREKELDGDAEEFIVSWATELPRTDPLLLVIHLANSPGKDKDEQAVNEAIRNYFTYRADNMAWKNRQLLREGWKNLVIGLMFLSICLFAAQFLSRYQPGALIAVLRESLIIGGWVAMWRPMEIFLYERWPQKRRQQLYSRLSNMKVKLSLSGSGSVIPS